MKQVKFKLIPLLAIFVFSCEQTSIQEYGHITEDPLFIEYKNEIESLIKNVQPKENINLNLTNKQIKEEFEQSDDIMKTLGNYVENSEYYIEKMHSAYLKAQILQKRYPEVQDRSFVTTSYINPGLTANFVLAEDESCRKQYDTDIAECKTNALIGAAACGLSAATLVGALGCGAAVIAYRASCGFFAERAFDNCVLAN